MALAMPTGSVVHADDLHTSVKGAVRQINNTIITHIISGRIANTGLCVQDLHTVLFVVIIIARNCDLEAQTPATVRMGSMPRLSPVRGRSLRTVQYVRVLQCSCVRCSVANDWSCLFSHSRSVGIYIHICIYIHTCIHIHTCARDLPCTVHAKANRVCTYTPRCP